MTADRARELAEKNKYLSYQFHFIYKATQDPKYKRQSYYYMELSRGLYIAAEALEKRRGDQIWE